MTTVLFACVHNAGRSQMAAAWFNRLADPTKARAVSAGTRPGTTVHPEVAATMKEVGIDLSGVEPRFLSDELAASASVLITMGCGDSCPAVPGLERDDWPLEDPKGKPVARVREIRDEVRARVAALIAARGWGPRCESASIADLHAVLALVAATGLPTEGVAEGFPDAFVVVRAASELVAVAGLEAHGAVGLLRSVAVAPSYRGAGLGRLVVEDRLRQARARNLDAVYLLTTTAADYFRRLGFRDAVRADAPPELQRSSELATICPSSAACLMLRLR